MGHSSPGDVCGKYSAAATAARLLTHERQRLALTEEAEVSASEGCWSWRRARRSAR
jgi:hypothetical protein